jgi:hypothetical protein
MLWLKAWLETRWKVLWMLLIGAFLGGMVLVENRSAPRGHPQALLMGLLTISAFFSFLMTIMLAGSGIDTCSTRPGESAKGSEGSTLFTMSLPVTRARLFYVRTVTGVIETVGLLVVLAVAEWVFLRSIFVSAHDALGTFAVIVSVTMALYGMSACLSTFCDEGWRIRGSAIVFIGLWILSAAGKFPRSINIFVPLTSSSPAVTHQIPWTTIVSAGVLAVLSLAAALTIIQKRDY